MAKKNAKPGLKMTTLPDGLLFRLYRVNRGRRVLCYSQKTKNPPTQEEREQLELRIATERGRG